MNSAWKTGLVLLPLSLFVVPATADAQMVPSSEKTSSSFGPVRELSEAEVVTLTMQNSLDIDNAMLAEKQADWAVRSEQGRYAFVLQANAGVTHSATPSLGRDKDQPTVVATRDSISLGTSLNKTFATGTNVTLSVTADRNTTPTAVGANITSGAGTGYGMATRLTAVQPLMRGSGTRLGLADLRAAQLSATAQKEARERVTSEVLLDSLGAYWELWYATQALSIEQGARALAIAQRDDAEARRQKGTVAAADVLSFDTRVATLGESVTAAELNELQRGLTLAQVLQLDSMAARYRATGEPGDPSQVSVSEVVAKLSKQSPELRELEARLALAESRADVAGDAFRPRLDLTGWVELRGLGNGSPAPAASMIGTGGAVSGFVGLQFESPLNGGREDAEAARARLDAQVAKNQLESARNRVRMTAAQLVAQLDAARARKAAAEQTSAIAAQQLDAERARFQLGTSTGLQVREAEDALRQARLRVARARVDVVQAALSIEHAEGELLSRHGASPKQMP